ncbi:MAG: PAS domain-containing protein [Planctomycetota bacterium]
MAAQDYESWLEDELFEQAPVNIAVIDPSFRIVKTNRNFTTLFGPGVGRKCFEVYKGRKSLCERCAATRTFRDGKLRLNEEVGVDRRGRPAWYMVHVAPIVAEDGSIPYVVEMSTDISESRRLRLEWQTLFEQVPCYVAVVNRDFRVVRANSRFREKFGDGTGEQCYRLFKRRAEPCESCPARETFADGRQHTSEHVGVAKDGSETHYVVTAAPASHADGGFSHVIEMAVDVTRERQAEKEKIEAERLAAVGQTVAGLAHGIKNILTGLEGGMYFLRSGKEERLVEGWEMLERNMGKISALARNLLSFSKGREPRVALVTPGDLVEEVVDLYREAAAREEVEVVAEVQEPTAPAHLDREAMHTCLTNLVSNAVDACRMGDRRPCRVAVGCRDEDGALVFSVEDEGCGMGQDVRRLVFTNFFTTKGSGGTGLGLLLTRKIVQEHGGRIELESEPSRGSVFRVRLPRDRLPCPTTDDAKGE